MKVRWKDYNGSDELLAGRFKPEWEGLEQVLEAMPLHLKASGQRDIGGKPIFDPVGTNAHIKTHLQQYGCTIFQGSGYAYRATMPDHAWWYSQYN